MDWREENTHTIIERTEKPFGRLLIAPKIANNW
jgi:hypothetical protein